VCTACLARPDNPHAACCVDDYKQFVSTPSEEIAARIAAPCAICSSPLSSPPSSSSPLPSPFVRLPCLHVLHRACLYKSFESLPQDTARAGYVCPVCSAPVFSASEDLSAPLSAALASDLRELPWAQHLVEPLLPLLDAQSKKDASSPPASSSPAPTTTKEKATAATTSSSAGNSVTPIPAIPIVTETDTKTEKAPEIRSPVAGVSVFVPPPPPSSGNSDGNVNFGQSAFANLPLTESVIDDGTSQDDYLGIRVPPLRVSGITSRKKEAGGRGARGDLTTDEDEDKVHNTPFIVLLSVMGLVKVVRGKQQIQWKRIAIIVSVLCLIAFLLSRWVGSHGTQEIQVQFDVPAPADGE